MQSDAKKMLMLPGDVFECFDAIVEDGVGTGWRKVLLR